jgi:F-type H+-transporting ATPase subunit delta
MIKLSRRALAQWGAEELLAGKDARRIAKYLVASLQESNRLSEIDFLLDDIAWELERRQALAIGKVTSAYPLTAKLQAELTSYLKKSTGAQQVVLQNNIDKSVIGGVRLETAGQVWDNTIKRKLSQLKGSY